MTLADQLLANGLTATKDTVTSLSAQFSTQLSSQAATFTKALADAKTNTDGIVAGLVRVAVPRAPCTSVLQSYPASLRACSSCWVPLPTKAPLTLSNITWVYVSVRYSHGT